MSSFVKVKVGYENGAITCDHDRAQLYQRNGPRGIEWKLETLPPEVAGVMIRWQDEPPFTSLVVARDGRRIAATGCRVSIGSYKYSILFMGHDGKVVAELDPLVIVEPDPPVWPDD